MQIAAGTFFTDAELRARPGLGAAVRAAGGGRRGAAVRAAGGGRRGAVAVGRVTEVCDWCGEPGDGTSALAGQADGRSRHPECEQDRAAEAGPAS